MDLTGEATAGTSHVVIVSIPFSVCGGALVYADTGTVDHDSVAVISLGDGVKKPIVPRVSPQLEKCKQRQLF